MPELIVKKENLDVYEVEANDAFTTEGLAEEQLAEITKKNEKFEKEVLQQLLLQYAAPCQCRMPIIQERMMTRIRLMPNPPPPGTPIQMQLLQEDVDAKEFGAIVTTNNGVFTDVVLIIVRCKSCNTVQFYGQIRPITYLMAKAFVDHTNHQNVIDMLQGASEDGSGEFMMTDLESGKSTECDSLGKALLGSDDGSLELGDAAPAPDNVTKFPGATE